ncbi:hypothetical protein HS041_29610 [Planomonospora sp. ID67723]|uniref:hypothetical protein n=1 Tax=Planomonospora sp. ID67723 TaxID=2738134 RepID=UPI0018C3BBE1|nr:hypothetical protein [Planomonospora sp. ID67723]MBG0831871.1 hypothetical protein [Planomonospora sp. ID67723]
MTQVTSLEVTWMKDAADSRRRAARRDGEWIFLLAWSEERHSEALVIRQMKINEALPRFARFAVSLYTLRCLTYSLCHCTYRRGAGGACHHAARSVA